MGYADQLCNVKWSDFKSPLFHVANGVRQGGVHSPYLYNFLLDSLSTSLNETKVGCTINVTVILC